MATFIRNLIFLIIIQIFVIQGCKVQNKVITPEKDWWETGTFYQIYPRSFKDSNGDGIGDLNGITESLDYLYSINITAAWLSPIFQSPMKDFGYDISDFYRIQSEYGTMEDFNKLLKKAHSLGIKIILDFVPNHTSDQHEWFQKSVKRERGFEDLYIWHDGYLNPKNSSNRLPPSNWLSLFRGSAWEWNDEREQFYLHQFAKQQPDLNYRNSFVVEKMKHVLWYWLDKGVDGFRVDAVPNLFEISPDQNGNYPDEPLSGLIDDKDNSDYLKHIYTQDQPETVDMIYQWRKFLDDYQRIHGGDTRVLLIESYSSVNVVRKYYGDDEHKGAHIPFNFNFIMHTNKNSKAKDFVKVINLWLRTMPSTSIPNWVMGNHDRSRTASRYGEDLIDTMNMLNMMLPGASITYNGEEIGMTDNNDITWEQTVDPAACNSNSQIYRQFSRDPARTPFQWDDTKNAGFSNGNKTWLPVNSNYKKINVKIEFEQENSHLKVFKELSVLRHNPALIYGNLAYTVIGNDVLVIERNWSGNRFTYYILVANMGNSSQTVDLTKFHPSIDSIMKYKILSTSSKKQINAGVKTNDIKLDRYESIIIGMF